MFTHGAFKSAPVLVRGLVLDASDQHCGAALRTIRTYDALGGVLETCHIALPLSGGSTTELSVTDACR